jgi:hypothetical protein
VLCAAAAAVVAGCGQPGDCGDVPLEDELVNPTTLACEVHPPSEPCVLGPNDLTWGACDSACRALDEGTCLTTAGCRAAYDHDCFFGVGPCTRLTPFLGCYPNDRNLDTVTGCAGLDAWSCSRHEQCAGTYRETADGFMYARCVPDPTPA